jgi:hypothetical protein
MSGLGGFAYGETQFRLTSLEGSASLRLDPASSAG